MKNKPTQEEFEEWQMNVDQHIEQEYRHPQDQEIPEDKSGYFWFFLLVMIGIFAAIVISLLQGSLHFMGS